MGTIAPAISALQSPELPFYCCRATRDFCRGQIPFQVQRHFGAIAATADDATAAAAAADATAAPAAEVAAAAEIAAVVAEVAHPVHLEAPVRPGTPATVLSHVGTRRSRAWLDEFDLRNAIAPHNPLSGGSELIKLHECLTFGMRRHTVPFVSGSADMLESAGSSGLPDWGSRETACPGVDDDERTRTRRNCIVRRCQRG
jgi:hypothetical protein